MEENKHDNLSQHLSETKPAAISETDKNMLLNAIQKSNSEFSEILMSMAEKYQILDQNDITLLCDRRSRNADSLLSG